MIVLIVLGLGSLVLVAIVVGIVDAAQASEWRHTASERRRKWESRQLEYLGPDAGYDDGSDED